MQNDIFPILLRDFPAFSDRWKSHLEYWGDDPRGNYIDLAEFVHFVMDDLYAQGKLKDVRRVFEIMERQLETADQETNELIGLGFFETVQKLALHSSGSYKMYEQFLGPFSKRTWKEIEAFWDGK